MIGTSTTPKTGPGAHDARIVTCEGAFNIRDLGGYETADGATLRWQTLYRADGLHRIPAEALDSIAHLGWRTVVDLRTSGEVETGAFLGGGPEVVHLPMIHSTWEVPEEAEIEPVAFLSAQYLRMLEEGAGAVATAFTLLSSSERLPAVFHCSAGKDRTGVLAALLLAALGVSDDVIADDYQRSSLAMEHLMAWLRAARPEAREEMARQPKAFLSCPPEAMTAFLGLVREHHGSVEGYLGGVGVAPDQLARLRELLLER